MIRRLLLLSLVIHIVQTFIFPSVPRCSKFSIKQSNNDAIISDLMDNCDEYSNCNPYTDKVNHEKDLITTKIIKLQDISQSNLHVNEQGGLWRLRYSSKKYKVDHRGVHTINLYLNTTTNMSYYELNYINNINGTLNQFHSAFELQYNSTSNYYTSKLKGIEFIRTPTTKIKHISLNLPLKLGLFVGLLKGYIRRYIGHLTVLDEYRVLYIDDEVCIHSNKDGEVNVFSRLYQTWDPSQGWTFISVV